MTRLWDPALQDLEQPSTPGAPQIVAIGPDNVSLTWAASTDNVGVSGYRLYDATTDQVVVDVTANSAILTGLAAGTYTYYVKAYDAAGNLSSKSGNRSVTITGTVLDTERPSNPSGLKTTSIGVDSVALSWNASTDNVGVVEYRVYNGTTNAQLLSTPTTTAGITGLVPGTYSYYVKALDAAGNASYKSNTLSVTITGPVPDTVRPSTPRAT